MLIICLTAFSLGLGVLIGSLICDAGIKKELESGIIYYGGVLYTVEKYIKPGAVKVKGEK